MKTKIRLIICATLLLGGTTFLVSGSPDQYLFTIANIVAITAIFVGGLSGIVEAFRISLELCNWEGNFGSFDELADLLISTAGKIEAWEKVGDHIIRIGNFRSLSPSAQADMMILRRGLKERKFSTRDEAVVWITSRNPEASWDSKALDLVFPEEVGE